MPIWIVIAALGSIGLTLVLASVLRRINTSQGRRQEDGGMGYVPHTSGRDHNDAADAGDSSGGDGGGGD